MSFLYSPLAVLLYLAALVKISETMGWVTLPERKAKPTATQAPAAAPAAVVAAGPRKTTYRQKYRTSHGGHAIGTVITGGLWAPLWAVFTVANKVHPGRKITERHHY